MNKNVLIAAIVVIALIAGGALLMRNQSANNSANMTAENGNVVTDDSDLDDVNDTEDEDESMSEDESDDADDADENQGVMEEGAKSFDLEAANYSFDVKEIRVKLGDKVSVTLENEEGMHDWNVDEFKAKTKVLQAGQEETVTFTADKKGTFEYYCSVGQHRANGMVGKLIVE